MSETKYHFKKLTPVKDVDLSIYKTALDFVFSDDDIRNVAISGTYGAGKSSLLETYKATRDDLTFIHISLAHFEAVSQNISETVQSKESVLEGKILNQLIHQIDPKKIPQTHFKVKQKPSKRSIFKWSALVTTFIILTIYFVNYSKWCTYVANPQKPKLKALMDLTTGDMILIAGVLYTAMIGFTIYRIVKAQKTKNIFKKIKLQSYEIEVLDEKDATCFDKYLNEVLYLFKNSGADGIVFEDIDRYNVSQIFEKLREVNTLVNKKTKKPIRFFYLLRDDIFLSKDRTKFFDFIIPVVPVIDGSNSYDKFIEHFKEGNIFGLFNEEFLKGLSLYIDDMRILKNIYNEFLIYHNRIQSIELDNNRLLALIVFKNIFPRDFNDLQLGMGFVHTIFSSKAEILNAEIQNIENQIDNIKEKIELSKNEVLKSIDELDAVYLTFNHQIQAVGRKQVGEFKNRAALIKAMKENRDNIIIYDYNYRSTTRFDGFEVDNLLKNPEYNQRKEAIENQIDKKISLLDEEIQQLNLKKMALENSKILQIITKKNVDTVFAVTYVNEIGTVIEFNGIKENFYFPLIKYLIRNGYIDETYPDYLTYFYENSLSRIDKIFLRSVTDEIPKGYSYLLKDPKLILSRLRLVDFDHEEILNFQLLTYLLENEQYYKTILKRFLKQLKSTENFKFVGEFLSVNKNKDIFVKKINSFWPEIFTCIINDSAFSEEQKKQYVIDTFYFSPTNDVKALNINNCITDFVSSTPAFLAVANPDVNKITSSLTLLDIQFERIEHSVSNEDLFSAVYRNNQYKLSFELIGLMLEKFYKIANNDDFKHKNYTLILSKPEEFLSLYIHENMDDYIDIVFDKCDKNISDEEFAVLELLNNNKIPYSKKEPYIKYLQTVVENINNITDKKLWHLLLSCKRAKYTAKNVLSYYFQGSNGLDQPLVDFINSLDDDLLIDYDLVNKEYGEESVTKIYKDVVVCSNLSDLKYEQFFAKFKRMYKSFTFNNIVDAKIAILIKYGCIEMNVNNLIFMRKTYRDHLMLYIKTNISNYVNEDIYKENFNEDEMLAILDENVDDKYKIKLLSYFTGIVSIKNKTYSDVVRIHILQNNFQLKDLSILLETFPNECKEIKDLIKSKTILNVDEVERQKLVIPYELLLDLIKEEVLSIPQKKSLFVLCLPVLDEVQANITLRLLQMDDFLSLFYGNWHKVEKNNFNESILEIFKKKDWIKSYDIAKDDSNSYRAYGR